MPMGLQLCAAHFSEKLLLGAAHAYERATKHAEKQRPLAEAAG
jgi:Asp-tRNA(Asn)/Glu-tRNA(Gln) amidotransferase A subunit family amidase